MAYAKGAYATQADAVKAAKHIRRVTGRTVRVVKVGSSGNGLRPWRVEIVA